MILSLIGALRLHAGRVAVSAKQAAVFERCERVAIAVLRNAMEKDIKPARQDVREIFPLVVDRRGAEFADQCRMRAARSGGENSYAFLI